MKTIYDSNQFSLLDDETAGKPQPDIFAVPNLDLLPKLGKIVNGEWEIENTVLGDWSGYSDIGVWTERHKDELMDIEHFQQTVGKASGPGRPRIISHFKRKHVRYFLNHSRLPHLRPYVKRLMIVIDEYEAGNLTSNNAATTIRLQDADEAAEQAAPGSTQLSQRLDKAATVVRDHAERIDAHDYVLGNLTYRVGRLEEMLPKHPKLVDPQKG